MNILAVETATDACSVALLQADGLLWKHEIAARQHTGLLLDMIDALLKEGDLRRSDIDALAFGAGPGSFTGVRIAASVIQGIAIARDLRVLPVSTLRALAAGAARTDRRARVLAALDARRQEVYFGAYEFSAADSAGRVVVPDTVIGPEDLVVPDGDGWTTAGNGWETYRERLPSVLRALPASSAVYPDARDVARLGALDLAAGAGLGADQALPRYLRGAVD